MLGRFRERPRRPILLSLPIIVVLGVALAWVGQQSAAPRDEPRVVDVQAGAEQILEFGGGIRVEVPAGAIEGAARMSAKVVRAGAVSEHPLGVIIGEPVEITLVGSALRRDVVVELPYPSDLDEAAAGSLFLARFDGVTWHPLTSEIVAARHVVRATTSQFSSFTILEAGLGRIQAFGQRLLDDLNAILDIVADADADPPRCSATSQTTNLVQFQEIFLTCVEDLPGQPPGSVAVRLVNDRRFSIEVTLPPGGWVISSETSTAAFADVVAQSLGPLGSDQVLLGPGDAVEIGLRFPPAVADVRVIRARASDFTLLVDWGLVVLKAWLPPLAQATSGPEFLACIVAAGYEGQFDVDRLLRATIDCGIRAAVDILAPAILVLAVGLDKVEAVAEQLLLGDWEVKVVYRPPTPRAAVLPTEGPPGTAFVVSWTGFSPGSTLTSHLQKPDGTGFPARTLAVDAFGRATTTIDSTGFAPGAYSIWGEDQHLGSSQLVEFTIPQPLLTLRDYGVYHATFKSRGRGGDIVIVTAGTRLYVRLQAIQDPATYAFWLPCTTKTIATSGLHVAQSRPGVFPEVTIGTGDIDPANISATISQVADASVRGTFRIVSTGCDTGAANFQATFVGTGLEALSRIGFDAVPSVELECMRDPDCRW